VRVVRTTHKSFWLRRKSLQHPPNRKDDEPQGHCLPSRADKSLAACHLASAADLSGLEAQCLSAEPPAVSSVVAERRGQVNKEISSTAGLHHLTLNF
jgi:hypothetical protein